MNAFLTLIVIVQSFLYTSPQVPVSDLINDNVFLDEEGLFESDEILELTLEGDVRSIMKDRGDDHVYHPMKLTYQDSDNTMVSLDMRVRTRGNFRRQRANCKKPPLTLNFEEQAPPETSLFAGETKLKLVVPCQHEKHVMREYLVYKLYNLVTDYSFRARPVKLVYHDTNKDDISDPEYGFLIEDEDHLAARTNSKILKRDGLLPEHMDKEAFHKMAVFGYMAGNTDWSIQYRHNIKLLYSEASKSIICVPYDFDLVGMVSASYAKPAEALNLRSVKDRRYRGYCLEDLSLLEPVFDQFRTLKPEFYRLYQEDTILDEGFIKSMVKYLDEFYKTIDDPKKCEKEFLYPCDKNGTGNVVIMGMDKG